MRCMLPLSRCKRRTTPIFWFWLEEKERIVISADSDFSMLLSLQQAHDPSFVLFREHEIRDSGGMRGSLGAEPPALGG